MSLLPLLAACATSTAPPTPAPVPEAQDANPDAALAQAGAIRVEPLRIHWDADSQQLAVEAHLVGDGVASRDRPVHVGVTVITEADREVDLLVHTLFPATMDQTLHFQSELDAAPKHVLIGAWGERIEPCASERPGCKEFGFVLDDSVASFPAELYSEGMRQRFIPDGLPVMVAGDAAQVEALANAYAAPFGAKVATAPLDPAVSLAPGVWVQRADDLGLAHAIATPMGLSHRVGEQLPAPVVVVPSAD